MLYPKIILPAHTETIVLNKFHCWHIYTHKDVAMVTSFCLHEAPSHVPLVSHSTGCRGRTSQSSPSQTWSEDCNQPEGVLVTGLGMDRSQTSDSLPWSTRKDALAWADSVCRLGSADAPPVCARQKASPRAAGMGSQRLGLTSTQIIPLFLTPASQTLWVSGLLLYAFKICLWSLKNTFYIYVGVFLSQELCSPAALKCGTFLS